MFEINQAAPGGRQARAAVSYEPLRDINAMSLLFWGEHCIECSAPRCYTTCDLYQPRADGRCRRFVSGSVPRPDFRSVRGYGVEITFKKWGKLETIGNTSMLPLKTVMRTERLAGWSATVLDRVGPALSRLTRDQRWTEIVTRLSERIGRTLHKRGLSARNKPDHFALEVYNPQDHAIRLQLVMSLPPHVVAQWRKTAAPLPSVRRNCELPPGYSRHLVPYSEFSSIIETGLTFRVALIPEGDTSPTLVFLLADFVNLETAAPNPKPVEIQAPAKCVVWDLDNTLWQGTLLESDNVQLMHGVPELLRLLDERGILISVASKNDYDLAIAKLKEFGIEEYILYPQISWGQKSDGLKAIAEKLNIGLDSLVFVDDNPFELAEVSRALPMVMCVDAKDFATLSSHPRLKGSTSEEAKRRRTMYREAMVRDEHARGFSDDYFSFLRSCDMHLRILRYEPEYYERMCELVQRTNQLNFSGRKYKREEIAPLLANDELEKWLIECWDKFGSYGVVGCGIVRRNDGRVRIEDFMLSCRVQGKFVEQAFFSAILMGSSDVLWVNFKDTGRNAPARNVLEAIGFVQDQQGMRLDDARNRLECDFITVEMQSQPPAATDFGPLASASSPA